MGDATGMLYGGAAGAMVAASLAYGHGFTTAYVFGSAVMFLALASEWVGDSDA